MKNYIFYVAFLCLTAWAGNHLNTKVPPPSPLPAVKSDSSSITKLQEYPAAVYTRAYIHPQ
ncbi:hypothetical protein FC093_20040 [Ilyomonas limi]|uniref:Uncharacterized protein n=1 Tax=Ilyomonas limi TaxID=2575867 RepID=A0A4V5UUW8_9BACT|nr:hypothetical protein [Ilyomonas limi]TKK65403.1 hypothetical protein FC093_20040 [Ilyomonas limi]